MSKKVRKNRRREPQISQMDKQGWKSLIRVIAEVVLTCVVAAGIPYGAYRYYQHLVETDYFLPRHITINGNVHADNQSILDASGLELENANLFETNVHLVEESIETLPWVKSAKVKVDLPDTVNIEINEHQPLGIVNDGQLNIVDTDGHYIKTWTTSDTIAAPIVSLDEPLSNNARQVVEAFDIAKLVASHGYPDKIQEIHYDNATGYTLYTETSEIRLGYDRFDERIERLLIVHQVLESKKVIASYVLLDADTSLDRIVVKPKTSYQPAQTEESDKKASNDLSDN